MIRLHLIGSASPLVDNLLACSNSRGISCEHSTMDELLTALAGIRQRRPDWIVYCGAARTSSWESDARTVKDAERDATALARLLETTDAVRAPIALVSSDRVFSGPKMFHEENDPIDVDADLQLRSLEQLILGRSSADIPGLVIRTNTFGWSEANASFAERLWDSLQGNESLELDAHSFATPILATDFAVLVLRSFQTRLTGVLHIAGAERTSPYRFGQELAAAAGFDRRLVRGRHQEQPGDEPAVAVRETSLASRRIRQELGVSLPLLRESIARFIEQVDGGYRDQLRHNRPRAFAGAA
jgi:dTDP-4-dehydrorhamnose reductase